MTAPFEIMDHQTWYFDLLIFLINMRVIDKEQQISRKIRLRKHLLYDKWPVENATSSFRYFHFSSIIMTFEKHFKQKSPFFKTDFQGFSKVLLFQKTLCFGSLDRKMTVIQIFFGISPKGRLLWFIVFVN